MIDYNDTILLSSGSSHSSFYSDSSSCGKRSPHPSSLGLRRSTMNLSELDRSEFSSQNSLSSRKRSSSQQLNESCSTTPRKSANRRIGVTKRKYHRGIEAIVEDTFPVIALAHAFSTFLSRLFDKKSNDTAKRTASDSTVMIQSNTDHQSCNKIIGVEPDDVLSPCEVNISHPDSNEEWDHFADFEDRLDECIFFVHESRGKLGTLDEIEEEDEAKDFFSF